MEPISQRLRDYRFRKGLSKRALAAQIGVSVPTIVRWESGEAEPNDYNLYKIEQLLRELEAAAPSKPRVVPLPLFQDLP